MRCRATPRHTTLTNNRYYTLNRLGIGSNWAFGCACFCYNVYKSLQYTHCVLVRERDSVGLFVCFNFYFFAFGHFVSYMWSRVFLLLLLFLILWLSPHIAGSLTRGVMCISGQPAKKKQTAFGCGPIASTLRHTQTLYANTATHHHRRNRYSHTSTRLASRE